MPVTNLIGQEGQGFNIAMSGINGGRVNICELDSQDREHHKTQYLILMQGRHNTPCLVEVVECERPFVIVQAVCPY